MHASCEVRSLRTNTELPAAEVARAYKSLWRVERTFREQKSTLEIRPLYHHRDDTSIGHIVACFLALRLEVDLQRRLDARGVNVAWPELMRDLAQGQAVTVTLDGQRLSLAHGPGRQRASRLRGRRRPSALRGDAARADRGDARRDDGRRVVPKSWVPFQVHEIMRLSFGHCRK